MTNKPIITAEFICTKDHWPAIFEPHETPTGEKRYAILAPAEFFPDVDPRERRGIGMAVRASSQRKPLIVIGDGGLDVTRFEGLMEDAMAWRYPVNWLLHNRPVRIAAVQFQTSKHHLHMPDQVLLSLEAIQIGGDFTKDEGLKAHIAERKKWFDL